MDGRRRGMVPPMFLSISLFKRFTEDSFLRLPHCLVHPPLQRHIVHEVAEHEEETVN